MESRSYSSASAELDTAHGVPAGTLVVVPTAPATGPAGAPEVSVEAVSFWNHPAIQKITAAGGVIFSEAAYSFFNAIDPTKPIPWEKLIPAAATALFWAVAAYSIRRHNMVTR